MSLTAAPYRGPSAASHRVAAAPHRGPSVRS
jgi:hypothetical protein